MKTLVGIVFAILLAFISGVAIYVGAFKPVQITEEARDGLRLIFVRHVGPYHKIVPSLEQVENWAKTQGLNCSQTFGEFLDNPQTVDEERLRANVGCILEATETAPTTLAEGFQYDEKDARTYVVARFDGAPSIGPLKVYPKVNEWADKNQKQIIGSVIEIYTVLGNGVETEYLFNVLDKNQNAGHQ